MRLLLDSHVVLWWQTEDKLLKADAKKAIATADIVWVSAATACEVAIKLSQKRLRIREPLRVTIGIDDFTELPVTVQHAEQLALLPYHHTDPFDRILLAQAAVEGATIVTHDRAFAAYGLPVIWT
jgi:PIN domain nuclease of toxin-antitoxin system